LFKVKEVTVDDAIYSLKYGKTALQLKESRTLIGLRPQRNTSDGVNGAMRRVMGPGGWREEGLIGGFRIIAVDAAATDARQVLDKLRLDSRIDVGTHVFEETAAQGMWVPTGEIFVEFKPGTDPALRWPRLFGQFFRFDEWSLCRG
jgi:hypothetical protein